MRAQAALPGWYGKLPALGDFASRRLPPAFIAAWDAWLAACVVPCQRQPDQAGSAPDAPAIAFWLAPGTIDADARAGVIAPSMDRVGRRFPFSVVAAAPCPGPSFDERLASDPWFGSVAHAIRNWTTTHATVERVEADLATCGRFGALDDAPGSTPRSLLRGGSAWWLVPNGPTVLTSPTLPPLHALRRLAEQAHPDPQRLSAETLP